MTLRTSLAAVLLIALTQGLVRVAVVPLWAHYDEPGHYEYVRFILNHHRLPQIADRDRSILTSIAATDRGIVPCPEEPAVSATPCFGPSGAFDEQPAYYLLQAAVVGTLAPATLTGEVHVMRAVSVLLNLIVVLLGFLTVRAAAPDDRVAAIAVAGLLAAIPGYVDVMSGVNNDIGAAAAGAFFMWTMARAFRDGLTPGRLAWTAVAVGCCLLTKTTAFIAAPLAVVGVWLVAWPRIPGWCRWGVPLVALVAGGVAATGWLWPAEWQASSVWPRADRRTAPAPLGTHVFAIWSDGSAAPTFWQPVDRASISASLVTVGAWMRTAGESRMLPLPALGVADRRAGPIVSAAAGDTWTFHRYTATVPEGDGVFLYLPALHGDAQYDGFVLTAGQFSDSVPAFDDESGRTGTWDGRRFDNLLRNGSAESGWPALRYWADRRVPAGGLNQRLASWLDWRRTWRANASAVTWQFVTFWGGYGNGVAAGPRWTRLLFAFLTAASAAGLGLRLAGRARTSRAGGGASGHAGHERRFVLFAAICVASTIAMSVLRIDPVDTRGLIAYIPAARYTYVAIVPMALLLVLGWGQWWSRRRSIAIAALVGVVLVVGIYLFVAVQQPWYAWFACRQTACAAR